MSTQTTPLRGYILKTKRVGGVIRQDGDGPDLQFTREDCHNLFVPMPGAIVHYELRDEKGKLRATSIRVVR